MITKPQFISTKLVLIGCMDSVEWSGLERIDHAHKQAHLSTLTPDETALCGALTLKCKPSAHYASVASICIVWHAAGMQLHDV